MGDLDRQKQDLDIIERVIGGFRDRQDDGKPPTHVVDIHTDRHSTVELTVGIADDRPDRSNRRRRRTS
jgi:hypothetical protein